MLWLIGSDPWGKNPIERLLDADSRINLSERIFPQPVPERHDGDSADIMSGHAPSAFNCGQRFGRAHDRQLATVPVNVELQAKLGHLAEHVMIHRDLVDEALGLGDLPAEMRLERFHLCPERQRVAFEPLPPLNDLNPGIKIREGLNLGVEAEPI